ncbi:ENR1 protein, partial [Rhynochetos jubatus]|nr:ENR1 protein [Rhynochetos jubatus]
SSHNQSKWGCNCVWKKASGAWKCKYCDQYGEHTVVGGPLGPASTLYYEQPVDSETWEGPFANGTWALKGHYWICGQHAYRRLPPNWSGICYVGYVCPLFFLLPEDEGKGLGSKVYDDLQWFRWSIDTSITSGSSQTWGKDERPPKCIIQHYGPATWNPSKLVSSARESVYNLNHIISLQAVLEITTHETARALDLLVDQATQMQAAIFQHCLVLDYVLAKEEGICGKLNDTNCCLKIDNNGEVVEQITSGIGELAHVPVETWKGWEFDPFSWLPGAPQVKCVLFCVLCVVALLLFFPCLFPCFMHLTQCAVSS